MESRAVIITGGAGGVGSTVTKRWLENGADVLIIGSRLEPLEALRDGLPASEQAHLYPFAADLTTEVGAAKMVEEAQRVFGKPVDTLVHLVGGFASGTLDAPDAPTTWAKMRALNFDSAFFCYRAVLAGFRERGGGYIVGLGSRVSLQPSAKIAAYAASKAGLLALTQSLSEEVKKDAIHVNIILASTIDTRANRDAMGDAEAKNWVTPDAIAEATFYLCSPQAQSVFGASLELNGLV